MRRGLAAQRPFRAPHHTISPSGLVGGGACRRPGEASLAHHGVLFLDELSEFPRPCLEALRQPLEDGRVVDRARAARGASSRRASCSWRRPTRARAATRRHAACRCTEAELARHRRRLSGPLLDRIDLLVHVQRPSAADLAARRGQHVRRRARAGRWPRASARPARLRGTPATCNAQMDAALLRRTVDLDAAAPRRRCAGAYERGELSARGHDRVLRVARTIADLEGAERVARRHVVTALGYRHDADPGQEVAA